MPTNAAWPDPHPPRIVYEPCGCTRPWPPADGLVVGCHQATPAAPPQCLYCDAPLQGALVPADTPSGWYRFDIAGWRTT